MAIELRRPGRRNPEPALTDLRGRRRNFAPVGPGVPPAGAGWRVDDLCQALPPEPPGPPLPDGSWRIAQRLMRGYEFADPSIVRAIYDPAESLDRRTMLLELRFHGLRFHAGVRVVRVYDEQRTHAGRTARVWGWAYATLEGHLEMGEMDWQAWKWLDTGEVQFRIHAFSRSSRDRGAIVRLGFRLFGRREQLAFLRSTQLRMLRLTEAALRERDGGAAEVHRVGEALTARSARGTTSAHEALGRRVHEAP